MTTSDMPDCDLSLPFVFVPNGARDPVEWRARHPEWISIPAVLRIGKAGTVLQDGGIDAPLVQKIAEEMGGGSGGRGFRRGYRPPASAPSGR